VTIVVNCERVADMSSPSNRHDGRWVHTWASMPMLAEGDNVPSDDFVSMTRRIGRCGEFQSALAVGFLICALLRLTMKPQL
jgi:hypothetical protein